MTTPETRRWAIEQCIRNLSTIVPVCPAVAAEIVASAAIIADWVDGVTELSTPRGELLLSGSVAPARFAEEPGVSSGQFGHSSLDSVAGVNSRNVAAGPSAVMALGRGALPA